MTTPPFCGSSRRMSSGTLRGTSVSARADECEKMTGAVADPDRVAHRRRRHVAEIDEHAQPVHFPDDLFAERRQAVELRRVGRRVGPRHVQAVRERHVARAEPVHHPQQRQRRVDRVAALHADERRDPPLPDGPLDVVGGERQRRAIGIARDHPVDDVDLLERLRDRNRRIRSRPAATGRTPTRTAPPTPPAFSRAKSVMIAGCGDAHVELREVALRAFSRTSHG